MKRMRMLTVVALAVIVVATALIGGIIVGDAMSRRRQAAPPIAVPPARTPVPVGTSVAPEVESPGPAGPGAVATTVPVTGTRRPATAYNATGRVLDLAGSPIGGAKLTLFFNDARGERVVVESGADGKFAAESLPGATAALISAEAPGHAPAQVEGVPLPIADLELYLEPLAGTIVNVSEIKSPGAPVTPYNGALTVNVERRHDSGSTEPLGVAQAGMREGQFVVVDTAQVQAQGGRVELSNLRPGITRISAVAGDRYAESDPFTVEPGTRSEAAILFGVAGQISGRILSATTSGPLEGAIAAVRHVSRPDAATKVHGGSVTSGRDGVFAIGGLDPGTYAMTLWADGFSTKTVEELRVSPSGQGPSAVDYVLVEGTAGVVATLTGPDGRPLANVPLVLASAGTPDGRTYFGRTDAAGVVSIVPVVAGRYALAATLPGGAVRQKNVEVIVNEGQMAQVRLDFRSTFQVSGIATAGGAPYEGLLAFARRGALSAEQYATADGSGTFTIELEPGEYMVSRPGDARGMPVEVRAGVSRLLELKFP